MDYRSPQTLLSHPSPVTYSLFSNRTKTATSKNGCSHDHVSSFGVKATSSIKFKFKPGPLSLALEADLQAKTWEVTNGATIPFLISSGNWLHGYDDLVINVLCGPKVKCAVGLIVTVLTGRGPRSPGSIEFLFLIWTGYFNLGSSWLSKERGREGGDTCLHMNYFKTG